VLSGSARTSVAVVLSKVVRVLPYYFGFVLCCLFCSRIKSAVIQTAHNRGLSFIEKNGVKPAKADAFRKEKAMNSPDFSVENHGSIFLLRPLSVSAELWVHENIGKENGFQPYWPAVVIEHRYVGAILEGISSEGLAVSR
jgi:hypothetical protein